MEAWWNRWWWLATAACLVGGFALAVAVLPGQTAEPGGPNGTAGGLPGDPIQPLYLAEPCEQRLCFSLASWQAVLADHGWDSRWEPVDRRLAVSRAGHEARLVADVPVAEANGHWLALPASLQLADDGQPLIPLTVLDVLFGWQLAVTTVAADAEQLRGADGERAGGDAAVTAVAVAADDTRAWPQPGPLPAGRDAVVQQLAFLQNPIDGTSANFFDSHVPGAPRSYRNGVHQGFDWYEWAVGGSIQRDTPIRAMAAGTVVRVDHGWETPSEATWGTWVEATVLAQGTPEWTLDRFRGRQVWIDHGDGVMVRYAHLDETAPGLEVGEQVAAAQVIGQVGNSGTGAEARGSDEGLHLHADILIYGENVWLAFTPGQLREMMAEIFALD